MALTYEEKEEFRKAAEPLRQFMRNNPFKMVMVTDSTAVMFDQIEQAMGGLVTPLPPPETHLVRIREHTTVASSGNKAGKISFVFDNCPLLEEIQAGDKLIIKKAGV